LERFDFIIISKIADLFHPRSARKRAGELLEKIIGRESNNIYLEKMRIWDISPRKLCRNHLLGEHRELHAIWNILKKKKKGYSSHPETKRWQGRLKDLYLKHEAIVREMKRRGYNHNSPLDKKFAKNTAKQNKFWQTKKEQKKILKSKGCGCQI
jgi:hypothetical protein